MLYMKRIVTLVILFMIFASANANAWFFFIPGSVTGAIADAITGDKGNHCVSSNTKTGDTIRLPGGGYGKVVSVSTSNSSRCNSERPIRALIDVQNGSSQSAAMPTANRPSIDSPTPATQTILPDGTGESPVAPPAMPSEVKEDTVQPPVNDPVSAVAEAPASSVSSDTPSSSPFPSHPASPVQRLRDLNTLFKEGLIDKKEYAEKKRKILDAM